MSSGKVQRRLCRARLLAGDFDAPAASTLDEAAGTRDAADTAERLELLPAQERMRRVAAGLRAGVAAVRVQESVLDHGTPLGALGLDSLLAVELKYRIGTASAVSIPLAAFLEETTLEDFAA